MADIKKREIAYKMKIGDILKGVPIIEEFEADISEGGKKEKFKFLELENGKKKVIRVNVIANTIEKYQPEGDKRWASITMDDGSGQIKLKVFGEDVNLFRDISEGNTILIIGILRSFNKEVYILPEIIKKVDPRYLLVRKLEIEKENPEQIEKSPEQIEKLAGNREKIIEIIKTKEAEGGIDIEQIIIQLKEISPDTINSEIKKILEDGIIYEPRPGRVRYLG